MINSRSALSIGAILAMTVLSACSDTGADPKPNPTPGPTSTAAADPLAAMQPCALVNIEQARLRQIEPSQPADRQCTWTVAATPEPAQKFTLTVTLSTPSSGGADADHQLGEGKAQVPIGSHQAWLNDRAEQGRDDGCQVVFAVHAPWAAMVEIAPAGYAGDAPRVHTCDLAKQAATVMEPKLPPWQG